MRKHNMVSQISLASCTWKSHGITLKTAFMYLCNEPTPKTGNWNLPIFAPYNECTTALVMKDHEDIVPARKPWQAHTCSTWLQQRSKRVWMVTQQCKWLRDTEWHFDVITRVNQAVTSFRVQKRRLDRSERWSEEWKCIMPYEWRGEERCYDMLPTSRRWFCRFAQHRRLSATMQWRQGESFHRTSSLDERESTRAWTLIAETFGAHMGGDAMVVGVVAERWHKALFPPV